MSEVHTWLFLVVAVVLAIVVGRLGTMLRDRFEVNKQKNKNLL